MENLRRTWTLMREWRPTPIFSEAEIKDISRECIEFAGFQFPQMPSGPGSQDALNIYCFPAYERYCIFLNINIGTGQAKIVVLDNLWHRLVQIMEQMFFELGYKYDALEAHGDLGFGPQWVLPVVEPHLGKIRDRMFRKDVTLSDKRIKLLLSHAKAERMRSDVYRPYQTVCVVESTVEGEYSAKWLRSPDEEGHDIALWRIVQRMFRKEIAPFGFFKSNYRDIIRSTKHNTLLHAARREIRINQIAQWKCPVCKSKMSVDATGLLVDELRGVRMVFINSQCDSNEWHRAGISFGYHQCCWAKEVENIDPDQNWRILIRKGKIILSENLPGRRKW